MKEETDRYNRMLFRMLVFFGIIIIGIVVLAVLRNMKEAKIEELYCEDIRGKWINVSDYENSYCLLPNGENLSFKEISRRVNTTV